MAFLFFTNVNFLFTYNNTNVFMVNLKCLHSYPSAYPFRYLFLPRMLMDVSHRVLNTPILNGRHNIRFPVGIAPTAMQKMAHPEGECASARAAQAMGTIFILSTISTSSIEEVAEAAPKAVKWFQLYIYKDRKAC